MGCSASFTSSSTKTCENKSIFINIRIETESGKTFLMQLLPTMFVSQIKSQMEMCIAARSDSLTLFIKQQDNLSPIELANETQIINYPDLLKKNPTILLKQLTNQHEIQIHHAAPTQSIATTNPYNSKIGFSNKEEEEQSKICQFHLDSRQHPEGSINPRDVGQFDLKNPSINLGNLYPQHAEPSEGKSLFYEDQVIEQVQQVIEQDDQIIEQVYQDISKNNQPIGYEDYQSASSKGNGDI